TYGHASGDEVLRRFASRLKSTLRSYDVLGRFGGEEFLVALQLKPEEATASFERLRSVIADTPIPSGSQLIPVTMSCGVCLLWPEEPVPPMDVILHAADTALYRAKEHGRNQVIFTHVPTFPVVEADIDDKIEL
ncbi:GGDEF domain-containing protein, partial [Methylophaga sp. UBA4204]